ncbi:MAG: hypothetical protein AAF492_00755, partial [Verrucomicrobiota bacterium]
GTDVTLVIDSCYSGSMLPNLTCSPPPSRVTIASAGPDEFTHFLANGLVSFSDTFFNGLLQGYDVQQAFLASRNAMSAFQTAMMDTDCDGSDDNDSQNVAATRRIGSSLIHGANAPTIGEVTPTLVLSTNTSATLWARNIAAIYPLKRVWAVITQPSWDPELTGIGPDPVEIELTYNLNTDRYEADYHQFVEGGTYAVNFYASDIWGSRSLPRLTYVTQPNYIEKVVLVEGYSDDPAKRAAFRTMGVDAFIALRERLIDGEDIVYISPEVAPGDLDGDGVSPDIDIYPSSSAVFSNVIANWTADADKLAIYLIGETTNRAFRINASNTITAGELDHWLDLFQTNKQPIVSILDMNDAGSLLPIIAGSNRITIAGTYSNQTSTCEAGGLVSFSRFFTSYIFSGHNIGDAFVNASKAIRAATRAPRQNTLIDSNGNRVPNEKGIDRTLARLAYFGTAFRTGNDVPFIGEVMPDQELVNLNHLLIWASDIDSANGISNVVVLITSPDPDAGPPVEIALTQNPTNLRWEVVYNNFGYGGTYNLTFFAIDQAGEISSPQQAIIRKVFDGNLPDIYEPDNDFTNATPYYFTGEQAHNFDQIGDTDLIRFSATPEWVFTIETFQKGENSDTVLDIYSQPLGGGPITHLDTVDLDEKGIGAGEFTELIFPATGWYYVAVSSYDGWEDGSEYDLIVYSPIAADDVKIVCRDAVTGQEIWPGAVLIDGTMVPVTSTSDSFQFFSPGNDVTIDVPAPPGYQKSVSPTDPNAVDNPNDLIWGNPRLVDTPDNGPPITFVLFQFEPYGRSIGTVRDNRTRGYLPNASLRFKQGAKIFDGFPAAATYMQPWNTEPDGSFPSNVWLHPGTWDLEITLTNYVTLTMSNVVVDLMKSEVVDSGTFFLEPMDTDGNGLPDPWEDQHNLPSDPDADTDGDGHSNLDEYYLGTDPRDPNSLLLLTNIRGSNSFEVSWESVPGRTYRVFATDRLLPGIWLPASSPMEAGQHTWSMNWLEPQYDLWIRRHYRVQLILEPIGSP